MNEEIKDLCASYNTHREYYQRKRFKAKELSEIFSKIGLPKSSLFKQFALKNGLILKEGKTRYAIYSFPSEPVYFAKLEKAISEFKTQKKAYNKRKAQSVEVVDSESNAIELLKSLGYKIYKPVTTFEEI